MALIASLLTFTSTSTSANAIGTLYSSSTGNGDIACSTSGFFTVTSNVVTGTTNCAGSAAVPEGVTALASGTGFYGAGGLTSITLPSTLVTIGDSGLRETGLTSVVVPASVTSIGFLGLASQQLTSVTFETGSQLTTIGDYAFQSTKFTSISIPTSVSNIGIGAFQLNPNLATINFLGAIPTGQPWDAPVSVVVQKTICDGYSRTCQVGENGPGGGTIYYYSSAGFDCGPTQSNTCNYLEVAPKTWSSTSDPIKTWANANDYDYEITGVTKSTDPVILNQSQLGLGYKDSLAIINNGRSIDTTTAAGAARAYSGGSKSDWYLPSPVELNVLCQWARGVTGSVTTNCIGGSLNSSTYGAGAAGFEADYYWSTTQATGYPSYAFSRNFDTGSSYSALKNANVVRVRPIRAFASPVTVAFNTQGGSAIASQSWSPGTSLTLPANPTRSGYLFNGWYDASTGGSQLVKNAISFDGNDDVITIPHSTSFNFTDAITIEAWINTTSTSGQFISTKNEDSFYFATSAGGQTGKLCLYLNDISPNIGWFCSISNVNDGNWHHVAATYDGSNMKLYIDGSLNATQSATGPIPTGSNPVLIGSRPNGYTSFDGKIYDVRFWNIARTASDINNAKNLELVGNESGLVAAYLLNQGVPGGSNSQITTATNSKSDAASGTLSNFALSGTTSNWVPRTSSYNPADTSGFTLYARWIQVISAAAIAGVTQPVSGATPVSTTTAGTGYTGTVTWASSGGALVGNFVLGTVYTAAITLTPTSGYTLTGVTSNFFTVAGATTVTHSVNSGIITAEFPATISASPAATISTTTFTTGAAANIGVSLTNFNQNLNYQATVKFVHPTSSVDVINGTLTATQGSTSLISGYDSYSGSKLGFTGSYAAITAALASITWNPLGASTGMKMRIGISTAPGQNEFYDANSGHYYRFVSTGLDAITARARAEQSILFGLRGYLVEIDSKAENDFVGRETSATNIWIGASDRANEGAFIWDGTSDTVTYPAPTGSGGSARGSGVFSSWASNEPNDYPWDPAAAPELEDCVLTNWMGSRGMWNDFPCRQVLAYLIEYGGRPNETSTAVSATLTATVNAVNPPTFIVSYNRNGATGAPARGSDRYITGRTEITLSGSGTMAKTGQSFAGWSISGLAPVITGTYAPSANVILKAVWTPTSYTITYDPNGGTEPSAQVSRTMGQTFTLAGATTRATSNGITYQFAFWRSGSTSFRAGTTITVGASNLIFTAVWVEEFEVTYSANGGAFAGTDTEKDIQCVGAGNKCSNSQAITLNDDPTRTGFTFAGWQTPGAIAVSDSTPGTPGVQTTVTSSNYIFIATWTAVDYTVTYVSDGSTAPNETAKNIGQTFTINATAPTKTNFEFAGWSDGTTTYWPNSVFVVGSSNITLTALWNAFYTVTYSEGLGSGTPPTDADTYRSGDGFELLGGIGIERSNFAFNGWSDGTTTYQPTEIYTVGTSNLTLTAQWVPVYTISYTQDRGPAGGTPPTEYLSYRNGSTFTVLSGSTLTNPGFTFAGWNDGTRIYQAGATYTVGLSNVTFAAQWTANPVANVQTVVPPRVVWSTYFDDNGASSGNTPDAVGVFENSNSSFILPGNIGSLTNPANRQAMAKSGFTFEGWSTTRTGTTPLPARFTPSANSTLYAIWKAVAAVTPTPVVTPTPTPVVTPTPTPVVTPTPSPTITPRPTPTPSPSATNPQPTRQMEKVGTVYKASGSYFLNDATKRTLRAVALKINASDAKSILVYGHTDNRGGVNNTVLSQNRARAVANFLRPLLKSQRVTIGWFASKKPVAGGTSAAALALNRRVEIYTK